MNQKNIFTVIGVVLVLQGIAFYAMCDKMAATSFPNLDAAGNTATSALFTVIAMLSILIGLVTYASRNSPEVVWAFAIGVSLLTINTLKHYLIDHLNVPIPALIIQAVSAILCIYLWMQNRNKVTG